jgi:uncharacterized protein YbbC (DUF1343 family)
LDAYQHDPQKRKFFLKNHFIDRLAGCDQLRRQSLAGKNEAEIRKSWQADLATFRKIRAKYLLYP